MRDKLKRLCQNCRFRKGSWCITYEEHKSRKDSCSSHNFKKELRVGR